MAPSKCLSRKGPCCQPRHGAGTTDTTSGGLQCGCLRFERRARSPCSSGCMLQALCVALTVPSYPAESRHVLGMAATDRGTHPARRCVCGTRKASLQQADRGRVSLQHADTHRVSQRLVHRSHRQGLNVPVAQTGARRCARPSSRCVSHSTRIQAELPHTPHVLYCCTTHAPLPPQHSPPPPRSCRHRTDSAHVRLARTHAHADSSGLVGHRWTRSTQMVAGRR